MKLLVPGGTGMLRRKMLQTLSTRYPDTWCTIRGRRSDAPNAVLSFLENERVIEGVDELDLGALEQAIIGHRFDCVINCIGLIKQRDAATVVVPSITINSVLPHRLATTVAPWGGRVIHFSTDCVFSGRRGDYSEADESDAPDLYGESKYLGEVATHNALTLRTSVVGRGAGAPSLAARWFLSQRWQTIRRFTRHYWSGVTTNYLAALVGDIIERRPGPRGRYRVSSGKIDKHSLLQRFKAAYDFDVEIVPDHAEFVDRSLAGGRLREAIGYEPPN